MRRFLAAAIVAAGCGGSEPARQPLGSAGTGPAYSSLNPSAEIEERAADFRGSCGFARPPGEAAEYEATLAVRATDAGLIQVRSSAEFDPADRSNVLGEIPSGTELRGAGPLAYGGDVPGVGWAVLVRDPGGRVCRGYVEASTVELVGDVAR
jgi:hypothetical protein